MSQERVYRTLVSLGLTRTDAKVYIYLGKKGPRKGKDIRNSLKMYKQQLYPCLKSLQSKGFVAATNKRPALFSALPFEKVLDLFIKANIEEVQSMIRNKEELLSIWQSMILNNSRT